MYKITTIILTIALIGSITTNKTSDTKIEKVIEIKEVPVEKMVEVEKVVEVIKEVPKVETKVITKHLPAPKPKPEIKTITQTEYITVEKEVCNKPEEKTVSIPKPEFIFPYPYIEDNIQ